jgi:hypothetical protein
MGGALIKEICKTIATAQRLRSAGLARNSINKKHSERIMNMNGSARIGSGGLGQNQRRPRFKAFPNAGC